MTGLFYSRGVDYKIPPDPTYPPARVRCRVSSPLPAEPSYPAARSRDMTACMIDLFRFERRRRDLKHDDETCGWRYQPRQAVECIPATMTVDGIVDSDDDA